jgi:hypothetical protein
VQVRFSSRTISATVAGYFYLSVNWAEDFPSRKR